MEESNPAQAASSNSSARESVPIGKDNSDLQVSIVSSTDINSCATKAPTSSSNGLEQSCNEDCLKCDICGKTLSSSRSFQNHMNIHNPQSKHVCPSCGKSYAWRASLIDHFKATSCSSMTSFDISNNPFESESSLHIVNECAKKDIVSYTGDPISKRAKLLQSSTDNSHVDISVLEEQEASLANYDIQRTSLPSDSHETSKDTVQKDDCNQRGIKHRSNSVLSPGREEEDFMYPCVDCGKPFKNEDQMWKHFEASHCVLDQSSSTCAIPFSPKPSYKSYDCPICHKALSSALGLKEHLSKHTGAKNFSCPNCGRRFAWRASVRKHLLRTSCGSGYKKPSLQFKSSKDRQACAQSRKAASVGCQKKLKQTEAAQGTSRAIYHCDNKVLNHPKGSKEVQHCPSSDSRGPNRKMKLVRTSSLLGVKKFAVIVEQFVRNSIVCQEGFGVRKGMAGFVDVGSAPEVGKHVCRVCSNVYKYKSSLKIHMRTHTGEVPYQCRICKQRYATHKNCRKHVLMHAEESESSELRNAVKQMMESKLLQKESNRCTVENDDQSGASTLNSRGESQRFVQEKHAKERKSSCNDRNQGKLGSHQINVKTSMQKRKSSIGTDTMSSTANACEIGLQDNTSVAETRYSRETRKRNVKYFDLGEGTDDEFPVKKRRKKVSKVVEDSLGKDESSDEEEACLNELTFKKRKGSIRKTFDSSVSEEDGMNASFESSLSNLDSSFSLQPLTSMSQLPKKNDGVDDIQDSSKLLFQCKICNTKFSSRFVLRRHEVITGHTKASYECPYCKRIYSEGGAYSNHMFVHQRENGMNCDICGKELQSRTTFLNHVEMHRKNPFNCEHCFEWFPTAKKLQEHLDIAHDNQKEFKCKYCKKTFDWQSNYTRHLNKHTNRKEFKCKICHYSFNIISNLKRHMASVHKGETELTKSTWEAVNPAQVDHVLNRQHQRRDLWQVKWEEGEDFAGPEKRRGRLKALRAENRKKYNCEICEFLCSSRVELTNHLRYAHKQGNSPETAFIHFIIEDENFICQLCGSVIYIRHSLKNHMKRVHHIEISDVDIAGVSKCKPSPLQDSGKDKNAEEVGTTFKRVTRNRLKKRSSPDRNKLANDARRLKSRTACTSSLSNEPTGQVKEMRSNGTDSLDSNGAETGGRMNCSLCKDSFQSTPSLVQHLHNFHKIPAGLEETLIALTRDVTGFKCDAQGTSTVVHGELGNRHMGIDANKPCK